MRILVVPADNRPTLAIDLESDSVDLMKLKIKDLTSIPQYDQMLIFEGKVLQPDTQVSFYGIQSGSEVFLDHKAFNEHVAIIIHSQVRKPTFMLDVCIDNTVEQVKSMIETLLGIPTAKQRLLFEGKVLTGSGTVTDFHIRNKSVLDLSLELPEGMHIYIERENSLVTLPLKIGTVEEIKAKLMQETGLLPSQQFLTFHGKKLKIRKLVTDYNIENESVVSLEEMPIHTFPVFIRCKYGKPLMIEEVKPTTTIRELKEALKLHQAIAPEQQRLTFKGRLLEDNFSFADCHIIKKSTIDLIYVFPEAIQTYIKRVDMESIISLNLEVDSLNEVKSKIKDLGGIAPEHQTLTFEGTVLKECFRLSDYGIRNQSTLNLTLGVSLAYFKVIIRSNLRIPVIILDGKASDIVAELKEMIEEWQHISPSLQKLTFQDRLFDSRYTLEYYNIGDRSVLHLSLAFRCAHICVQNHDTDWLFLLFLEVGTVNEIQAKIEKKTGLLPSQQILTFRGKRLRADELITDYEIENGAELDLYKVRSDYFPVFVNSKFGKPTIRVYVMNSTTVIDMKETLKLQKSISLEQQRLIFNGRILEDRFSIADYHIKKNSNIDLILVFPEVIQICIKRVNGEPTISLNLDIDSVDELKSKMKHLTGIAPDQQMLTFGREVLKEGFELSCYGVKSQSAIYLERLSRQDRIQIFVTCSEQGSTFDLDVDTCYTIETLKALIFVQHEIPIKLQRLYLAGKLLEDTFTLAEYQVSTQSTLDLVQVMEKPLRITVKTAHNNPAIALELETDSVNEITSKIMEMLRIPPEQQVLTFLGKVLKRDYSLSYYRMENEATIWLEEKNRCERIYLFVNSTYYMPRLVLDVNPSETIGNIKMIMANLVGILPPEQKLTFDGERLRDNASLTDSHIGNKSTLEFTLKLQDEVKLLIKWGEKQTIIFIDADSSIEQLKAIIADMEGVAACAQKLTCQGRELENGHKLIDYSIQPIVFLEDKADGGFDVSQYSINVETSSSDG